MNKKAAIIIVNWNGEKYLKSCLNAVFSQTYQNFEVFFVDNGSSDSSLKIVKNNFPAVNIIKLDKNYGFAKANNIGIEQALKKKNIHFIVFLNNDTRVYKQWLASLLETANKSPSVGMVSSKALFPNGIIQNAGLSLEKGLVSGKEGGSSLGYGLPDKHPAFINDVEIFAPGGVAALFKRKVLEEIGFFDEDFFAYAEDFDLGLRARLQGWRCLLSTNAKLVHYHSRTGGVNSKFKLFHTTRNRFFVAYKNFPFPLFIRFIFYLIIKKIHNYKHSRTTTIEYIKGSNNKFGWFLLLIKSFLSVIFLIPKMTFKRLRIQKRKKVGAAQIINWEHRFCRDCLEKESKLTNTPYAPSLT